MATEKRYIDANAFKIFLCKCCNILRPEEPCEPCDCNVLAVINEQPTVDAVEVVHGRWDEIPNKYMSVSTKNGFYSGHATNCSVCHEVNPNAFKTNYCPNCGAMMDGDGNG